MKDPCSANDTQSLWVKSAEAPSFPRLISSSVFDIAIIGAGIVGVLTAHALRNSGQSIALIEGAEVLQGVTGNTTGKLTSQHGLIYHKLRSHLSSIKTQHYFEANEWALKQIREYVVQNGIACDFTTDDAYVVVRDESSDDSLFREIKVLGELHIPHEVIRGADVRHGGFAKLKFPNQAHFNPRKYLLHLLQECVDAGVQVFEHSRVEEMEEHDAYCTLFLERCEVTTNQIVVATNYPIHDSGLFVTKLAPYRSYASAFKLSEPVPPGMFITHEESNLHSTRPSFFNGEPVLIVGGGHHKVGQSNDADHNYQAIDTWTRARYEVDSVIAQWSTQDNWTPDGRPFIGRSPHRERIFLATGFGGWGMTTGMVASAILSSALDGIEHEWAHLYDPSRLSFEMVPKLVSENLNSAMHLVGDAIQEGDRRKPEDLKPGEAAIMASPIGRLAVHRDHQGDLHMVDAHCTHWGCQVAWNNAEQTWDCPCHGSRFNCDGEVLHGPATTPLAKPSFIVEPQLEPEY